LQHREKEFEKPFCDPPRERFRERFRVAARGGVSSTRRARKATASSRTRAKLERTKSRGRRTGWAPMRRREKIRAVSQAGTGRSLSLEETATSLAEEFLGIPKQKGIGNNSVRAKRTGRGREGSLCQKGGPSNRSSIEPFNIIFLQPPTRIPGS
jgi:hypothetical protein